MKLLRGFWDAKRLTSTLEEAIAKEASTWRPRLLKAKVNQDAEIGPSERDEAVRWLATLSTKVQAYPETFAMSVSILDRFLNAVKAIPSAEELVCVSECGCTANELLRMERIILDKLGWNLKDVTALDFLHIFHALLTTYRPQLLDTYTCMTPSRHLAHLTRKLQRCMACHQVLGFPGSVVSLALLSLELEMLIPDWLAATFMLQKMVKVQNESLIRCREVIARHLAAQRDMTQNMVYIISAPANKSSKRKVGQIEDDDMYDGIKRLYDQDWKGDPEVVVATEEVAMVTGGVACSSQLRQDRDGNLSPTLPPLQPITAMI
ncbi:CCNI [Branchiostoma lanceolatum]|uniref:CCNI protein n=1 Tax=Branchiostoma lanceolatum TaxID=7740 RepID=A0A8K0A0R0_BRALA|nr:CCNI [Branchiostoma lanceolatum]